VIYHFQTTILTAILTNGTPAYANDSMIGHPISPPILLSDLHGVMDGRVTSAWSGTPTRTPRVRLILPALHWPCRTTVGNLSKARPELSKPLFRFQSPERETEAGDTG
jgi:hypothetical protein